MTLFFRLFSALVLACALSSPAAHASNAPEAPEVSYINLMPGVVGNYAAGGNKLKFYKADIALRIMSTNKDRVTYHEPLIRDQLVLLFSQKTDEDFAGIEGKEAIRKEALERVRQALTQEEGEPLVDDLLFNNLVVQN